MRVKGLGVCGFREAAHPVSTGDLDLFEIMKTVYGACIHPDHGRMIRNEAGRPGCGLYGCAPGAADINGLWEMICKSSKGS